MCALAARNEPIHLPALVLSGVLLRIISLSPNDLYTRVCVFIIRRTPFGRMGLHCVRAKMKIEPLGVGFSVPAYSCTSVYDSACVLLVFDWSGILTSVCAQNNQHPLSDYYFLVNTYVICLSWHSCAQLNVCISLGTNVIVYSCLTIGFYPEFGDTRHLRLGAMPR